MSARRRSFSVAPSPSRSGLIPHSEEVSEINRRMAKLLRDIYAPRSGDREIELHTLLNTSPLDIPSLGKRIRNQCLRSFAQHGEPSSEERMRVFSETAQLTAATARLSAHLNNTMSDQQKWEVSDNVATCVGRWLADMCGMDSGRAAYFSSDQEAALEVALLHALFTRFPDAEQSGLLAAMRGEVPTIYTTDVYAMGSGVNKAPSLTRVLMKLGLSPNHCRIVPFASDVSGGMSMDMLQLQAIVEEDLKAGLCPLMVISSVGTAGFELDLKDDLRALRALCNHHQMSMHVMGTSLALLLDPQQTQLQEEVMLANTVCLDINHVFGLTSTSTCTFVDHEVVPFLDGHDTFDALPWWVFMQRVGRDYMINQVSYAVELVAYLKACLEGVSDTVYVEFAESTQSPHLCYFAYDPLPLLRSCMVGREDVDNEENDPEWFPSQEMLNQATRDMLEQLNAGVDLLSNPYNSMAFHSVMHEASGRVLICFSPIPVLGLGAQMNTHTVDAWLDELELATELLNATWLHVPMMRAYFGLQGEVQMRIPDYLNGNELPEEDEEDEEDEEMETETSTQEEEEVNTHDELPPAEDSESRARRVRAAVETVTPLVEDTALVDDGFEWVEVPRMCLASFRLVPSYLRDDDDDDHEVEGEQVDGGKGKSSNGMQTGNEEAQQTTMKRSSSRTGKQRRKSSASKELDTVNEMLAAALGAKEPLCVMDRSVDGNVCVVVESDKDEVWAIDRVRTLVGLLRQEAEGLELTQRIFEDLSDVLVKSIQEAKKELAEEKLQKQMSNPVSMVPLVGPMLSWLTTGKDDKQPTTLAGRTFDIRSKSLGRSAPKRRVLPTVPENVATSSSSGSSSSSVGIPDSPVPKLMVSVHESDDETDEVTAAPLEDQPAAE